MKVTQPLFVPISGVVHVDIFQRLGELSYRLATLRQMDSLEVFEEVLKRGLASLENDSSALDFKPVDIASLDRDSINTPDWTY